MDVYSQGLSKIFRAATYRAHRAVVFAIAQLLFLVGGATSRKTFLFVKEGRFGRSRSSKVTDTGANRKRIVDFLLVPNSNFGPTVA